MIKTIAHIADIHIRKTPTRNDEYQKVFDNLIKSLKEKKPDRIVIVGDLVNDYLDLQGEQLIMANKLLNDLADIAPVRITRGNHDCRKKSLNRVDSVRAIVETLDNSNVIYYDKTDVFYDENIAWFVWHHGEKKNNPWKTKEGKIYESLRINDDYIAIDLFHDPVSGCISDNGLKMQSKQYYKLTEFKGDYSFFGDIHRKQYLDEAQTKAFCGSLIPQKFSEGDDEFHGYLLWDIEQSSVEEILIKNDYSYKNIKLSPYVDFDDLDFEIENPTKHMRVRFIWGTLPSTRNTENERKVVDYLKNKYGKQILLITHKNEFFENDEIEVDEDVTLENINDTTVQHAIFREYLDKIGTEDTVIDDVVALDEEISADIDVGEINNIQWDIIKFGGTNFASYEQLDIDWGDMDGLFQITGINTAGKSTIMKLITYILYGKSLETDYRQKFGDRRFVNNRNNATSCETYMVLEANGEYFGIKRKTEINQTKAGSITGAPTTLSYYALESPDDELDDTTSLDALDEDLRVKTQKKLDAIVGDYENFKRIVMTTSDTLNNVLSSDMSVFVDSLLYDSGLDIFDKKLTAFKEHVKKINQMGRTNVDVDRLKQENADLIQKNVMLQLDITTLEKDTIPTVQEKITKGRVYVETLTKKLFKIDPEIVNLNVIDTQDSINAHDEEIGALKGRKVQIMEAIELLQTEYDEERLNELIEKRDGHKQKVYEKKVEIKEEERVKSGFEHRIEILNGEILTLKRNGKKKKEEIAELKKSKNCPTCGQLMDEEHREHIDKLVKEKEKEMFDFAKRIGECQNDIDTDWKPAIMKCDEDIKRINKEIVNLDLEMEDVLVEIGELTNQKNDVEKSKELQAELAQIPTKIENEELKKDALQKKINDHENSKKQIEENVKIQKGIDAAKKKISELETEEDGYKQNVAEKKSEVNLNITKIEANNTSITTFEEQEYRDRVLDLYKKCVHRDGIPKQMLANYVIPSINKTLDSVLTIAPFKVWLDIDDFRPKLIYNSRPTAIIDCIGASGKERTFSSVVLKFALNQVNVKAKPTIFLLDEVMGKLTEDSVDEFIEILHTLKENAKKILIIEHDKEVNPDYLIKVDVDENGISFLNIE